ncbi:MULTISPECIES: enoyl-CoA hydratase/isomerase family protein [Noviherbaspirillum]|uniref:enoyl-CoA hydratase/isomerase family protein n=1 Tax=Noviherbaspirillum TaxID=1344552 RepID=UPI00124E05C1|nr:MULTISPECIES: enoyl-CoA hydratase/isomerase family protein [Noviherbaspirillum]
MNVDPSSGPVVVSTHGRVGILELARPEKFNCLSTAAHAAIDAALSAFEHRDSGVRAVLVRANGKHFCTGADLDEVKRLRADPDAMSSFIRQGHAVLRRLEASPLPVVAAVQGMCLAGGLELMLACDVVFAASSARFGDQHAQFGLVPGWGGSQRLPRAIGLRRSMDLFLSARWIDAQTALQWGLVNAVCEDDALRQQAFDYCAAMAERSCNGLAAMKRLARAGLEQPLDTALKLEETQATAALLGDDVGEGLAAFEQRRKPEFGGWGAEHTTTYCPGQSKA